MTINKLNGTECGTEIAKKINEIIDSGGGSGGRNVGEIITSTLPLTDAGLHLLDGTLLQYGIYKEFIDYMQKILVLITSVRRVIGRVQYQLMEYAVSLYMIVQIILLGCQR